MTNESGGLDNPFNQESSLDKTDLRQKFLVQRMAIPDSDWLNSNQQVLQRAKGWLKNQNFQQFVLYRSFRREPDLSELAELLGPERCFYPKVFNSHMMFFPGPPNGQFIRNRWGLEEPPHEGLPELTPGPDTLIVIPGLAFDQAGYRLGYGGGFFDRYLSQSSAATLGLCFDKFLVRALPHESHDIPVQTVITESHILRNAASPSHPR